MNKSSFGQVVASVILAVPMVILVWFLLTPHLVGSDSGTTTDTAGLVFKVLAVAIALYFAVSLAWKYREKGKKLVGEAKDLINKDDPKSWWGRKDIESRRWFLYIALAVIAITTVYITPEGYKEYRFQIGGWIILLGLHLVIWPFYTEKISLVTKVVITGFLLFFITAVVFPNATQVEIANMQNKKKTFDKDYGKPPVVTSQDQTARRTETIVANNKQFSYLTIPDDRGYTFFCPSGTIMEFTYNGMQESDNGFYDCDANRHILLGDKKTGRRIGFMSKSETETYPTVTIASTAVMGS